MKKFLTVFNTKELLFNIAEYLTSSEIYQLLQINKLLQIPLINTNYDYLINEIYFKLYKHCKIKKHLNLLVLMTNRVINMGHTYSYKFCKNVEFLTEEICIRNILFEEFNYEIITSLYYILHECGCNSLISRFVSDKIIASPYECTHSNIKRNTEHYYGNEQTLRIALRFKNHDIISKILSDIEQLSTPDTIFNFMWSNCNMLYESIYNMDIIGFKLILDFAKKHNKISYLLLESSNDGLQYSNYNHLYESYININNYRIQNAIMIDPYPHYDDDNVQDYGNNALLYALHVDLSTVEDLWNWDLYRPEYLDRNDFIIHKQDDKIDFVFSKKFEDYLDLQFFSIINYCDSIIDQFKFFNIINEAIKESNINIFSPYKKKYYNCNYNVYLLIELLAEHYKNTNLFLMISLIIEKVYCANKFNICDKYYTQYYKVINIDYKYLSNLNGGVLIDYIKLTICHIYEKNNIFAGNNTNFIYFINLLLCYKKLNQ